MDTPQTRRVETNGLTLQVLEQGTGPLVLLCHGWPEIGYSWRHQIPALAQAGYRVVAPDMRGYGGSDAPEDPQAYTMLHAVGDLVGLLDALGEASAVIVGHDWGAVTAWSAALFRPDRFRAVAGLAVPYQPRGSVSLPTLLRTMGLGDFYILRFQEMGRPEAELEADLTDTFRRLLYGASGNAAANGEPWTGFAPAGRPVTEGVPSPKTLPPWLTEAEVAHYVEAYRARGFRGSLGWYRSLHATWELTAAWTGAPITVPSLFIGGQADSTLKMPGMEKAVAALPRTCRDHRGTHMLPNVGHWVQQEAATPVTEALLAFLRSL